MVIQRLLGSTVGGTSAQVLFCENSGGGGLGGNGCTHSDLEEEQLLFGKCSGFESLISTLPAEKGLRGLSSNSG